MGLDTILFYDATGGGTATVVAPTSFTIKGPSSQDAWIVGYFYDGISAEEVTVKCGNDTRWHPDGFSLPATTDGTAVGNAGFPGGIQPLPFKVPVRGGDLLSFTCTSGANPVFGGLLVEYPGGVPFGWRSHLEGIGGLYTRTTSASGTNLTAATVQEGLVKLDGFDERVYTPVSVQVAAAYTTTPIIGIRKLGSGDYLFVPLPLTDVAQSWGMIMLPRGIGTFTAGDTMQIAWLSSTAEQPTAKITFSHPPKVA